MKPPSDLRISPTPWGLEDKGVLGVDVVVDANRRCITGVSRTCDVRLMKASPKLYFALYEAVVEKCHGCIATHGVCRVKEGHSCNVTEWKRALEEASGEVK